jgi:SAM-dependent methyltransferase
MTTAETLATTGGSSHRDLGALRRHYAIERELADRLRRASPEQRRSLYRSVYDELFLRVPDHPQNTRKQDPAQQEIATLRQLRLLDRFLKGDSVYLEVGCGDCHLARAVARQVSRVYAVDVSEIISGAENFPSNFTMIVSDGVTIAVPWGTVDVAYSNQLMEHLHPDDAFEQLVEIFRSMAGGGVYVCTTPHRHSGPHDISQFFDTEARGFHLKEYTYGELRQIFRRAGFATTSPWWGIKGHFVPLPEWVVLGLERVFSALPVRLRQRAARARALRTLFGSVTIVGGKAKE